MNGVYRADITLSKRGGAAKGEVFDAQNQLAANTQVFGSGIETVSDAAGRYLLAPLPTQKTEIIACKGDGFALGSSDQTRLDLKPQTLQPTDVAWAKAVLDALREETRNTNYWRRDSLQLEPASGDFASASAKALASGETERNQLISRFGNDANVPMKQWSAFFGAVQTPQERLSLVSQWTLERPSLNSSEATRALLARLQADVAALLQADDLGQKEAGGSALFQVAAFAEKIGDTGAADALFKQGEAYIKVNSPAKSTGPNPSPADVLEQAVELAAASPRLLNKFLALTPPGSSGYTRLLAGSTPALARGAGLDAARPFLDRLKDAPTPPPNAEGFNEDVESTWAQTTLRSIRAGGHSNPQLALELARALPPGKFAGDETRARALCEAARFQSPEVAEGLWREFLPQLKPDRAMRFIARLAATNEPEARSLYELVQRDLDAPAKADANLTRDQGEPQTAEFAFYESRFAPARARFRLERAWMLAQQKPNVFDGVGPQTDRNNLELFARAMAVFDASRALRWADQIERDPNNGDAGFEAKWQIARWLALDSHARDQASPDDRNENNENNEFDGGF